MLIPVVSNEGGAIDPAPWSIVVRPMSDWVSDSRTDDAASTLLDFLESWSRGSSWHRWPIFRFMHLVHGLSYSRGVGPRLMVARWSLGALNTSSRPGDPREEGDTYKIARHVLAVKE